MSELIRCTKCVLPQTHETITFDEVGGCNVCAQSTFKQEAIDWDAKKEELHQLVAAHRDQHDYDCIVPFSGGKDSTWTLYYLVKEYGLKPLVVRFDHGFMRPNLEENCKRTFRILGVDSINFTPNWHVVRKLMLQSLLEKGDFCWHCHTGIFSYPMWVALQQQVPLIFWGEPSSEYTSYYSYDQPEEVDEKRFNRYINLGITADDMFVRLGGAIDKRDLKPYSYPPLRDLRALKYRSVCLGSYIPWDVKTQSQIIMDELGWQGDEVENVPSQYPYEKIECYMQGVRDYIKYLKRGYTRPSHLASIDIRHNRLERDAAMAMIKEYEGKRPPSLDIFLNLIGITQEQFDRIVSEHIISPHQPDFDSILDGKKTWDFDRWSQDGGMSKEEAATQLANWRGNKS